MKIQLRHWGFDEIYNFEMTGTRWGRASRREPRFTRLGKSEWGRMLPSGMANRREIWLRVLLVLLALAVAVSFYQLAFSVWMTAYPFADIHVWRARFYLRLSITGAIGACWIVALVWLVRTWRRPA